MKLLVIRHAVAMDREEFAESGQSDDMRPLTRAGMKEMKRVAKGLRREVDTIDVLATSPLLRATQTADIVAREYGMDVAEPTRSLIPEAEPDAVEEFCGSLGDVDVVAVVGHEPHLTGLVTWLMSGRRDGRVELKKGGACMLEFESGVRRDSGTLLWLATRGQLKRMAG